MALVLFSVLIVFYINDKRVTKLIYILSFATNINIYIIYTHDFMDQIYDISILIPIIILYFYRYKKKM